MNVITHTSPSASVAHDFIEFALKEGVLSFGEFITKAGRKSPYFFNAGRFNAGGSLGQLARFYARTLLDSGIHFDMLFGPAYKGITLASATAVALADLGHDTPFAYNRKEAKDHGEGGVMVGAPLSGNVVIIDDVISAGTSVRESVQLIRAAGATPCAVLIALDRMERGANAGVMSSTSAVQDVSLEFGLPVLAIANLANLLHFLEQKAPADLIQYREPVNAYRQQYGVG